MTFVNSTSNVTTYTFFSDSTDIIPSLWATHIFQWLFFTIICQSIDICGICTNIINIFCFVKQGFKDPVNISLLGLAISDLGCLVPLIWTNICYTPAFDAADIPFSSTEVQYLTAGAPHVAFIHVSGWITALITLERCICISMPLKVKTIITPRRTCIIIVSVFLILISSSMAPVYVATTLGVRWSPSRNKTIVGLAFTSKREIVERYSFIINNSFVPFSAFLIIVICTIVLVIQLQETITWRKKVINFAKSKNAANRNQKVAKMVVMVSILFIVCFIPEGFGYLFMSFIPELSVIGKYRNALTMIGGLCIVLESINSSVNIFIYYNMSSKYRETFRRMFGKSIV